MATTPQHSRRQPPCATAEATGRRLRPVPQPVHVIAFPACRGALAAPSAEDASGLRLLRAWAQALRRQRGDVELEAEDVVSIAERHHRLGPAA